MEPRIKFIRPYATIGIRFFYAKKGGTTMNIQLKNGENMQIEKGATVYDVAKQLSEGLARNAVAGEVNGVLVDLNTPLNENDNVTIITLKDPQGLEILRHTTSHILAQAVKEIYPTAKLAIGPATEDGFYYDFDFKETVTNEDLAKIEAEMKRIIKADFPIERKEVSKATAVKHMKAEDEIFKLQIIDAIPAGEKITMYKQGEFEDVCRGPHLPRTGMVKAFKLTKVAGAYWRGDSRNKMLTRIYGVAFEKKSEMDEYFVRLEEALKRDHNKLGRELELFTTTPVIGQGLPLLLPKGARVVQLLQRFVEDEEEKRGYLLTKTPLLAKSDLYRISGHWDHYRDGMFVLGDEKKDEEVFALRPMTCPFQFQAYLNKPRSYKDLPLRYNETSTLFRNEASGEMHGLIRVRQFTISEGHIACRPDQLEQEFKNALSLAQFMLKTVGLEEDVTYRFSKWDENDKKKYIGSAQEWETVQNQMRAILNHLGITFTESNGDAAFYGPKLDIQIKNVFGKEDTLITIQIDFQLAKRFEMVYTDQNNEKQYPYVIHRTSLGCYERTLALLIEKYAGAFPMWLAPVQAVVMNVSEKSEAYAEEVANALKEAGIRTESDLRGEKIGYKIRQAQLSKVPYMLILGENEANTQTVSLRKRNGEEVKGLTLAQVLAQFEEEIRTKKLG